ncbi:PadR family transcriptional regulator [Occultella glacieicola]|uniref:PadR family transcriptional regulator n=1 Tax=Occultella glacieicola TaxID=2518684 RepID=A0ABY2E3R0_9MICO|nr:helix-turn-helix transcriptional regulator [Occultella glacieicola]TDE94235.1 PadR family transcriptional regulator [Occultella glacieicola]
MISADFIRGYVDLLVLESLLDQPSYGYAISKRIEELSRGQYEMKETTLYSAVRRLEKTGAVTSFQGTHSQGRARTYYRLTEFGRRFYDEKCEEWRQTVALVGRFVRDPH